MDTPPRLVVRVRDDDVVVNAGPPNGALIVVRVTSGVVKGVEGRFKKVVELDEGVEETEEVGDGKTLAPSLVALGAVRRVVFRRLLAVAAPAATPHRIPMRTITTRPIMIRPRFDFHQGSLSGVGDGS